MQVEIFKQIGQVGQLSRPLPGRLVGVCIGRGRRCETDQYPQQLGRGPVGGGGPSIGGSV